MKYQIGNRIRKYRLERKISQKELASMIGVSPSRVSNWEQGINRPDADIIADICRALSVSPSDLLDVRISPDLFSDREKKLIESYRNKPELQLAVDILLDIKD